MPTERIPRRNAAVRPSISASSLLAIVPICLLLACGAQGPPRPPRVEQPERITDATAVQVGRRIELRFTAPVQATDGERLSKPVEVQIFRGIAPPGQRPSETVEALKPRLTIAPADPSGAAQGAKVEYDITLTDEEFSQWLGSTFTFSVRALTRGFRGRAVESEFSNGAQIALMDVSAPPADLRALTTEKYIELSWSAPRLSLARHPISTLAGYQVYRGVGATPNSFQLLGETASPGYHDPNFQFDRTYAYKVRVVFKQADRSAESEDSLPTAITPHDTFPPETPTGLQAVYAAQVVELIWKANAEPDLAGYNVYRRGESGTPQRINQELLPTPIYRDSGVEPGHKYSYRVTAVDLAGNESPPSAEMTVESH